MDGVVAMARRMMLKGVTIAAAVVLLAGCVGTPAVKPGAKPLIMTIGTDDKPGVPAAAEIQEFAQEVHTLSNGAITIKPTWHAAGDVANWDQAVAGMVVDGKLDLGLIPSRTWGDLGATSLEVINTPFLVQSDALVNAVLSGSVATELMAGLPAAGVVGIGMLPEGLRHPFGYSGVLTGPASYGTHVVRAATSGQTKDMFAAWGATTNDNEPSASEHVGGESSFLLNPDGTATGNVTFYPKVNVLVAAKATWAKLSEQQRDTLTKAAKGTLVWAGANVPTESAAAKAFCAQGGKIAAATPADIQALERATTPVAAKIAALAGNASIVAKITALRDELPAPKPVTSCEASTSTPTSPTDASALNGTYRYEITAKTWADAGVTDAKMIASDSGKYTVQIADGVWKYTQSDVPNAPDTLGHGLCTVSGDQVVFAFSDGSPLKFTWKKNGAGDLQLTPAPGMGVEDSTVMSAETWTRVG